MSKFYLSVLINRFRLLLLTGNPEEGYELLNDKLIFEATSGKKLNAVENEVTNYSVTNLQRVVLINIK